MTRGNYPRCLTAAFLFMGSMSICLYYGTVQQPYHKGTTIKSYNLMINASMPLKKQIRAIEETMQQRHENNYDVFNSPHRDTITSPYANLHTEPIHAPLVVYNRVPKCASSTTIWIISKLESSSRFQLKLQNWPKIEQILTPEQQIRLARNISKEILHSDMLYVRHLHFLNFEKFSNIRAPIYINIIRDPIERFISHYYYMRYGFDKTNKTGREWDRRNGGKNEKMLLRRKELSLDECVHLDLYHCVTNNSVTILSYFCGQEPKCRMSTQWALDRAKENVVAYYVTVGLVEDLSNTIKILEYILPRYFEGASAIYLKSATIHKKTRTAHKVSPSLETKQKLREALRYEVEFYSFIKGRFYAQVEAMEDARHS